MKTIQELLVDENFEIFTLVKGADVRVAKNGKKFIAFTFEDKTGTIEGKFWDASNEEIEKFKAGSVVALNGKKELYNGNPQVKILHLRLTKEGEPQSADAFVKRAPLTTEKMTEEFNAALFEIENPNWNRIVRYLLNKYQKEFYEYPAAKKNHHAFLGGLAFHTLTMLHLAKGIASEYEELNASLLYAGLIIHDLGKVIELSGPMSTEYTMEGNLVGHLVLVDEEIIKACDVLKIDTNHEDVVLLRHMVLSHHGLLEYGSPVRPALMEAEVLHQIDNLDASIQMMKGALSQTAPGSFSERVFGLDNRRFYKRK